MKRNNFFITFCLAGLLACTAKNTHKTNMESHSDLGNSRELLVGTYTGQGSDGIYLLDFDVITGVLSNVRSVAATENPSFLAMGRDRQNVYAVNETHDGMLSSFTWNDDRSALTPLNQQASQGDDPCHIELSPNGALIAVANYTSGNILVFPLDAMGKMQKAQVNFQHEGSGPVMPNQKGAHAHCVKFDANGKYLYTVDLGIDQIITYPISGDGTVGQASASLTFDPGDGPRHLIFHPKKDLAFAVNELSSSVVALKIDHRTGVFEKIDKKSTLPEDFQGKNYCADIHISNDGKFLYASNRGHHSIAIFSVSESGHLEKVGIESVHGDWPRNFALSPDGEFLLVANQKTNNITVFKVNKQTGLLTFTGQEITVSQPVALLF